MLYSTSLCFLLQMLLLPGIMGFPACMYDGKIDWDGPREFTALLPCDATDKHQRWSGPTLAHNSAVRGSVPAASSQIHNEATGYCLSTISHDPARVVPCKGDATRWFYNTSNYTLAVAADAHGTLVGKGIGACLDVMGGSGPDVVPANCLRDCPHSLTRWPLLAGHLDLSSKWES